MVKLGVTNLFRVVLNSDTAFHPGDDFGLKREAPGPIFHSRDKTAFDTD